MAWNNLFDLVGVETLDTEQEIMFHVFYFSDLQ